MILEPLAAAPIISALAAEFYVTDSVPAANAGPGWGLIDDPLRVNGLTGGSFDDAGFPAAPVALAADGVSTGYIWGPGSLWRRSFRTPPTPAASNLSMPGAANMTPGAGTIRVSASRFVPLQRDIWVLELRLGRARTHVRLSPGEWLARFSGTTGDERTTPDGPVIPSVILTGLSAEVSD